MVRKPRKRKSNKSRKGGEFERELCKRLSLWWTNGKRDDVFWRSANSGGRAKSRGRAGKRTHGQHGDIGAVDPIGEPLIDLLTIEIKRGYSKYTMADLLDRPATAAQQQWELWYEQVYDSWQQSASFTWLMITRRDQREAVVFIPAPLFAELLDEGAAFTIGRLFSFTTRLRRKNKAPLPSPTIYAMTLNRFLKLVTPTMIKQLSKRC